MQRRNHFTVNESQATLYDVVRIQYSMTASPEETDEPIEMSFKSRLAWI